MNAKDLQYITRTNNKWDAYRAMLAHLQARTWVDNTGQAWRVSSLNGRTTPTSEVGFHEILPPARDGRILMAGRMPLDDAFDRVTGALTRGDVTHGGFGIILK